jgi:recombination protein RecA
MGRHKRDCQCLNCKNERKDEDEKSPEIEKVPETPKNNSELDKRLKELERKYSMKPASEIIIEPKIRTGVYAFDYVTDGGIAQCEGGHKIELYGRESSGKTTLAMKVVAKFQEMGKSCVWINAENNLDSLWAEMNGVKPEKLLVTKPETLETAGDMIIDMVGKVDLIVIDSISMLLPAEELEGSLEDKKMASQAKVNAPFCRKLLQYYKDAQTVIIFINQMREKVGVMYGNPETTSGGRALKHLYDTRIEVRIGKPIEEGTGDSKERVGHEIIMKNTKNKKGKAFLQSIVDFYSTAVFDNRKSLIFAGLKYCVIKRDGNTYTFKNISAVGQDKFMDKFDDKLLNELETEIWKIQR